MLPLIFDYELLSSKPIEKFCWSLLKWGRNVIISKDLDAFVISTGRTAEEIDECVKAMRCIIVEELE